MTDRAVGLVLDSCDPRRLAPFWATALTYAVIVEVDNYVLLMPADRSGPELLIQKVPEEKAGKNRVHFDIVTVDIETVAAELEAAGAQRVGPLHTEHGSHWLVMHDPEGNESASAMAAPGLDTSARLSPPAIAVRIPGHGGHGRPHPHGFWVRGQD